MKSSGGSPRDLTPTQITDLHNLFSNPDTGLWWFCREIFGFRDLKWEVHGRPCQIVGHWGETRLKNGLVITHTPKGGYEEDNIQDSYRRIMIRIPREFFKTSCFTRAASLYIIAQNPDRTIAIFNETQDKPIQWLDATRQVAETSILFQTLYRDLIPKGIGWWDREAGVSTSRKLKWGGTGMQFERGSIGVAELSIEPHGIMGTAVGKHFTHMIWDDIIGLKASESNAVMDAAVNWVDNSRAIERPLEGGCVLVNHTTWAYHDVYKHMEEKWPGEWLIHHRSLLENPKTGEPDDVHGESTFPEKISTKKAYAMKTNDEFVFAAQYQCYPKAGRAQSFDPAWDGEFHIIWQGEEPAIYITKTGNFSDFNSSVFNYDMDKAPEYAPQTIPLSWCTKGVILDPAPSKGSEIRQSRHARNGIVVDAIDPWGRIFNLESRPSSDSPETVLEIIIALSRTWQAWTWSVEEVVFSAVYQPLWSTIMFYNSAYQDCQPEWHPAKPKGRDKSARIRNNLIKSHQAGFHHYNTGDPTDTSPGSPSGYLLKEKNEFPHGQTVDMLDAHSYIEEVLHRPQTPEALEVAWWRNRAAASRGRSGYGEFFHETPG